MLDCDCYTSLLSRDADHRWSSGIYDEDYLEYLRALLESMTEYGIVAYVVSYLFVDFESITHWPIGTTSRCVFEVLWRCEHSSSLGQEVLKLKCQSGAPGWTLEAAGFDLSNGGESLAKSGSAYLDGIRGGRLPGERGLWPTGEPA